MSDLMLTAVLSMPYNMAMADDWSRRQFYDRAQQALDEIERLTAALKWEQHRAERQGTHGEGCANWGPAHYECLLRERDELRQQLAEAGESIAWQAATIRGLTRPAEE